MKSINSDGCFFKNPINGDIEYFDAIRSMYIQCAFGVDLAVVFDECTVSGRNHNYMLQSMKRSHDWSLRSLEYFKIHKQPHQHLYGLVHGGTYKDLRKQSVDFNLSHDFDAYAIGGTLGKTSQEMYDIVQYTMSLMKDVEKPIHLLGIGRLNDLDVLSKSGVDTFDCVEPTRIARHGTALTFAGRMNLNNIVYKYDYNVMDVTCGCTGCSLGYTKSYLHYLLKIREKCVFEIITEHNMWIMNKFMQGVRDRIDAYV